MDLCGLFGPIWGTGRSNLSLKQQQFAGFVGNASRSVGLRAVYRCCPFSASNRLCILSVRAFLAAILVLFTATSGAKALIILAMDKDAILPAVNKANQRKIPVVAYDRLIEAPGVFYITFDNVEVGRMQARAIFEAKPKGNYVMIKGSPTDPNADFLRGGQQEIIDAAMKKGDIKIVGEEYTDGWKPEVAQKNMEQILTKTGGKVDAVVASNDGTAGGVVAALNAKGIKGIPVSGQDGDHAALNRVAMGSQTVSVWKDARDLGRDAAAAAVTLAKGQKVAGAQTWSGGEKKVALQAQFLKPVAITAKNLDEVVNAGWIKKADLCKGVDAAKGPAACK